MRLVNTLPLLLSLAAAIGSSAAWALPTDREQPIRVQADSAELDDKQGVAVYRGDVVVTQGSMKLTGNTVTLKQNKNGDIEVVTSVGKPAYFEQKPSPEKEITKAYGLTIQYFVTQNRVVLIDQAKVIQEGNTFEGEKIVYDTQRQIVNAGRATGAQVTTPRPRIDMVIQPKKKQDQAQ
ncbi:lipopolysaccharide transport periplasmic protein LptA [Pseudomonas sp. QE6]|uniref:lipopolysaccharide transport periplasmic protein LptA n=1 Tax=Pseudomonas TaxID=286 RepID=UPI0023D887C5|nr:lipopolysaccharide transport periplasmic protein LptA [Pseudomonas sp. PSE14]WEJ73295.1 lipopolysaccharide transport periplasmic protein LptA [Pseudomonas sp. PSE14]